ncbi:MAG: hypothetical protein ACXADW_16885, partial [Candidatus Hodarchaeales archaeon]
MEKRFKYLLLALVILVILILIGLEMVLNAPSEKMGEGGKPGIFAPEIHHGEWINSEPLSIGELKGKVVLIDFWT